MTIKFFHVLSICFILFACKGSQEDNTINNTIEKESQEITEKDIAKLKYIDFLLDSKTEVAIERWQEYIQLKDVIANIKNADLSFFNDNEETIKNLLKDLKTNIPETVNTPSILARLLVIETKIYKLESLSNLNTTTKPELLGIIKEFLVSFSNLNLQMNKKMEKDGQNIIKP